MYLLAFNVRTRGNEFNFKCLSKKITVKQAGVPLPTFKADPQMTSLPPNYILKFEGDYSTIVPEEVKANLYNFMAGYNVSVAGIRAYSGSVYVSFYSDSASSSLVDIIASKGLEVDSNLRFAYATINDGVITCTSCTVVDSTTPAPLSNAQVRLLLLIGLIELK